MKNNQATVPREASAASAAPLRVIPSPDFAEALVLTYAPEPIEDFVMPSVTPVFGGRGAGLLS
ncbi:hypothetical protein JJL56_32185 [Azospirillum sp. YIM DDC1]|uniref:Uncharacterized protein n=1 Tax=Azospirillum aestuarii TaxID=2802052 RepID=A0ABS1I8X9_9PROT|nr:hypothetical protein [Azospirillum aestuarii]MBK4723505.1 hypothetical protein [Azospirillum aestuarii]